MTLISRPSIPEVIFERIKSDLVEFGFNFFQDGVALDVAGRTYKVRLKASGIQVLDKASTTNAAGRVTFALTNPEKATLTAADHQLFLVEILAGNIEKTLMSGTLRWSVATGKSTGLQAAADVSVNYITATDELMVALGVVDFGSMSSGLSAAAAAGSAELAAQIAADLAGTAETVLENTGIVIEKAEIVTVSASEATDSAQLAKASELAAATHNQQAQTARQAAEAAASNALIQPGLYETEAAGRAAVSDGQAFRVQGSGNVASREYRRIDAATSTLIAEYPSLAAAASGEQALEKVTGLETFFKPNEFYGVFFPIIDALKKLLMGFDLDGSLFVPKFRDESIDMSALKNLLVGYSQIADDAKGYMLKMLDARSGFVWGVFDVANKILIACRTNGQIYIPSLDWTIPADTVGLSQLSAQVREMLEPKEIININDRVETDDDGGYRGKTVDIPVKTGIAGSLFVQFPRKKTPVLQGINTSGVAIELRQSSAFLFKAAKYIGSFAPLALTEISFKGVATTAPSTAGRTAGDYYKISVSIGSSVTINGQVCYGGDLIVFDAGNWTRKPAPQPAASALAGQWWNVTGAGTFDGISYAVGDIIYVAAMQSGGAAGMTRHYLKLKAGEYAFSGEFNPTSFAPAEPIERAVYIASAAGTFSGANFEKYDMLLRLNAAWHKVPSQPVQTIPANGFFIEKCTYADELEVRRADVLDTPVAVTFTGRSGWLPKTSVPNAVAYGDSMIGAALPGLAAALAPRAVTLQGYGGAKSEDILSMAQLNAAQFTGYTYIWYHGQNSIGDVAQVKAQALKMLTLCGARDKRFLFLSVLGARSLSWNGTRLVADVLEPAFAGTGNVAELEGFYQQLVPGNYLNTRQFVLASAASITLPDLTFPGLTQAQAAAQYGWTPHSYHFSYDALPYPAADLVFKGYHNSAAAPTGGTLADYYISRYAGQEGKIWINVAGTWTGYTGDDIHVTPAARPVYNEAIKNFLTLNKI